MEYSCYLLRSARAHWRALSLLQDIWTAAEYRAALHGLAALGASVVIARHGGKVVGSMMLVPASEMPGIAGIPGLPDATAAAGLLSEHILCRTNTFVARDFRGRGVSVGLHGASCEYARAHGYTHSIGAAYASREILSWASHRADKIDAGILDLAGDPVYFLPLA